MKKWLIICSIILTGGLSSCIEIIDDLTLNVDGSGTFKYTVNLSSSKVKVNSVLALDSLDGKAMPTKEEVMRKVADFKGKLANKEGIKNVVIEEDYTNYIFKLSCTFDNVDHLQEGIKKTIGELTNHTSKTEYDEHQWVKLQANSITRSIPQSVVEATKKLGREDGELLKQGSYTSITRLPGDVIANDNQAAQVAKNNRAVMLKVNPYALLHNTTLISNKITFND